MSCLRENNNLQFNFLKYSSRHMLPVLFCSRARPACGILPDRIARELCGSSADGFLFGSFQEPVETCAANAEKLRGANSISFASVENSPDMLPPDFFQWKRTPGIFRIAVASRRLLKIFREVIHVDKFVYGGKTRTGNDVFQ